MQKVFYNLYDYNISYNTRSERTSIVMPVCPLFFDLRLRPSFPSSFGGASMFGMAPTLAFGMVLSYEISSEKIPKIIELKRVY